MKIKVMLVDDELPALELLKSELLRVEDVEIISLCSNGFEAVKKIDECRPDLVFLDIEMPRINGFDVIELIKGDYRPYIVLVTAYNEYAVEAFEKEALDFIVKPPSSERLQKSVDRFRKLSDLKKKEAGIKLEKVSENREKTLNRILVKTGNDISIINVKDVVCINAEDDYVRILTKEKGYLKNAKLSEIMERLPEDLFMRVHRSHIINVGFLKKIEPYTKNTRIAVMEGGHKVSISKAGYSELKELL